MTNPTVKNTYTGDGSTSLFPFTFPYIQESDVKVYLDDVEQTITTQYEFSNATTIGFITPPGSGVTILIKRETTYDDLQATFFPGSAIRARDLNDNFVQNLYVVQENAQTAVDATTASEAAAASAASANTSASSAQASATTAQQQATQAQSEAAAAQAAATSAQNQATQASADASQAQSDATQAASDAAQAASDAAQVANINAALSISGGVVTALDPLDASEGLLLPDETSSLDQESALRYNDSADRLEIRTPQGWETAAGGSRVSTSPPTPASEGDNWYDPDTGRTYVYYNDGDSVQWVEANPSWNGSIADGSVTPAKLSTGGPNWDSSGNVGIGLTSPARSLDVSGIIQSQTSNVGGVFYGAYSGSTAGSQLGILNFYGTDASVTAETAVRGLLDSGSLVSSHLTFSTSSSGSLGEKMRINSNGQILLNTTNSTPIHAARSIVFTAAQNGSIAINHSTANDSGDVFAEFGFNGTKIGSITQNGTSAVSYNTSSDYRLKENIVGIADGITRVKQLQPSRFNFIAEPGTTVDGFLAHEAQAVVPEAVTGEKDAVDDDGNPEYQAIDQSKLVPLLTAALQEAIAKIESLETRISQLEAN